MALDVGVLNSLTKGSAEDAWRVIINNAVEIASKPLAAGNAPSEVIKRDREIGTLDHFLSSTGWDLWQAFGDTVERTSDRLARWWTEPYSAKAVLVLDEALEKYNAQLPKLEEVKPQITQQLTQTKLGKFQEDLRAKAKVK